MHDVIHDRAGKPPPPAEEPPAGWRDYAPAFGLLVVVLIALAIGNLMANPVPGQYLVVTRPGLDRFEMLDIVFRANGGLVGTGGLSNIAVAVSEDPGFAAAMRDQGAWLVLPSPRLLGCFTPTEGAAP